MSVGARQRLALLLGLVAGGATAAALLTAACDLTSGLTGAPGVTVVCDAALQTSGASCGQCGVACPAPSNAAPLCADAACAFECLAGFQDCNHDAGDGCESRAATDPANCGACAHSCLGGACVGGACQPITLYSGGGNVPVNIALDSEFIYGVNANGTVIRLPKDGGPEIELASNTSAVAQSPAPQIAVDPSGVYWTVFAADPTQFDAGAPPVDASRDAPEDSRDDADDGAAAPDTSVGMILHVPTTGGVTTPARIATAPYAVAVQGGGLSWSEGNPSVDLVNEVRSCALVGSACGSKVTTVSVEPGRVEQLAADGSNIYFTNGGLYDRGVYNGSRVRKCARLSTGGGCDTLARTGDGPQGIAFDKLDVYWTTQQGSVDSCAIAGCTFLPLALDTYEYAPRFIAVDARNAYFTTGDGAIKLAPLKVGKDATLFQLHGSTPWSIAVDATAIYWTDLANTAPLAPNFPGPAVRKLAK